MTTNEIAAAVQSRQADILELWQAVRRFALQQANRWCRAMEGRGGVDVDDLEQVAFLALLDTLGGWDAQCGSFLTLYSLKIRTAFAAATWLRTERDKRDPLNAALSIDAPLTDNEGEPFTIADTVPDTAAQEVFDAVDLQTAVHAALAVLTPEQYRTIVGEFWFGKKADGKTRSAALKALRHPAISSRLRIYL